MTILVIACLATVVTQWLYHHWWTWAILIGSAGFDTLLYLFVGDVVVCYRCDAQYRGYPANAEHKPHELVVAERYRLVRLRREQLRSPIAVFSLNFFSCFSSFFPRRLWTSRSASVSGTT